MDFFKSTIVNLYYNQPESLYYMLINSDNFAQFVQDLGLMINYLLIGDVGHMWVTSFRKTGYVRSLLQYACKIVYSKFFYVDLMGDASSGSMTELGKKAYLDRQNDVLGDSMNKDGVCSYKHILNLIYENFAEIWAGTKLIIMVYVSNKSIKFMNKELNDVLGLIDCIVFNTDMIVHHFGDLVKKMCKIIKIDKLYSQFSEIHLIYLMRNKLEKRVKFVVVNEISFSEIRTNMS